jgi:uncharacterized protein (TIGR02246 family)
MQPFQEKASLSSDEINLRALYRELLGSWNKRNAGSFAALFAEDGAVVGFDGSQMTGREEIASTLADIFAHHSTAPYVGKVRGVRFLSPDIAILQAVVGMVPVGQSDLNPNLNAIQTLVGTKTQETWHIALFQNTPAQLHGRPELVQQMTEELQQLLK